MAFFRWCTVGAPGAYCPESIRRALLMYGYFAQFREEGVLGTDQDDVAGTLSAHAETTRPGD